MRHCGEGRRAVCVSGSLYGRACWSTAQACPSLMPSFISDAILRRMGCLSRTAIPFICPLTKRPMAGVSSSPSLRLAKFATASGKARAHIHLCRLSEPGCRSSNIHFGSSRICVSAPHPFAWCWCRPVGWTGTRRHARRGECVYAFVPPSRSINPSDNRATTRSFITFTATRYSTRGPLRGFAHRRT